jgi:hypothetical protein
MAHPTPPRQPGYDDPTAYSANLLNQGGTRHHHPPVGVGSQDPELKKYFMKKAWAKLDSCYDVYPYKLESYRSMPNPVQPDRKLKIWNCPHCGNYVSTTPDMLVSSYIKANLLCAEAKEHAHHQKMIIQDLQRQLREQRTRDGGPSHWPVSRPRRTASPTPPPGFAALYSSSESEEGEVSTSHPQDGTPHTYCAECDCCTACGCCEC